MEGGADVEALPSELEPLNADAADIEVQNLENEEAGGADNEAEEEENPFADDDDSEDEGGQIQVTIRKEEIAKPSLSTHGKLDIDLAPTINDKPIYDIDLAQMEDRPWRKPGADITDYFNYGFTEDTWNVYCERQKKLRAEFQGNQAAANKSLFSSIQLQNPLAHPVISQSNNSGVVKVLTDNGGRFKANQYHTNLLNSIPSEPIMRTVIGGNPAAQSSTPMANPPIIDFSKPPPGISMPPPGIGTANPTSSIAQSEAPPGITPEDKPPGVSSPTGAGSGSLASTNPPGIAMPGLDLNLGIPPPGFNPMMPPPGIPPSMGMLSNVPPPGFSMPPPQFAQSHRAGFSQNAPGQMSQPRGGYEEEDERRSRRKRSRSRSRSPSKKDRESRRRGDRDRGSDRTSSRRHRSRSSSKERKRDREDRDREKRRERRDDEERSKKSSRSRRGDDDDDRRERKEKRSRHAEESHSYVSEVKTEPPDEHEQSPYHE